eukprot:6012309-Prymnesium_polylepis.3
MKCRLPMRRLAEHASKTFALDGGYELEILTREVEELRADEVVEQLGHIEQTCHGGMCGGCAVRMRARLAGSDDGIGNAGVHHCYSSGVAHTALLPAIDRDLSWLAERLGVACSRLDAPLLVSRLFATCFYGGELPTPPREVSFNYTSNGSRAVVA